MKHATFSLTFTATLDLVGNMNRVLHQRHYSRSFIKGCFGNRSGVGLLSNLQRQIA